jgi:hypothetical protein
MKIFILAIVLIMLCPNSKGQNIKSDSTKFMYCEIVGTPKLIKHWEFTIRIDSGQLNEPSVFISMTDALNFMSKNGWEFVQAYIIPLNYNDSPLHDHHFLLKKKIN